MMVTTNVFMQKKKKKIRKIIPKLSPLPPSYQSSGYYLVILFSHFYCKYMYLYIFMMVYLYDVIEFLMISALDKKGLQSSIRDNFPNYSIKAYVVTHH